MREKTEQITHGLVTRAAAVEPSSINEAARTVEVCWSTGARVTRSTYFDGDYIEELSLEPGEVRLERLEGAPVLDSHARYTVQSVLGVVEAPRVAGGRGYARLRFSERAEPIWQDVKSGILRQVSVGGRVYRWERTPGKDGQLPVLRAVDWEPQEISLVPIGADPGATVRADERSWPCEIVNRAEPAQQEDGSMNDELRTDAAAGAADAGAGNVARHDNGQGGQVVDLDRVRREAAEVARREERERVAEIQRIARHTSLGEAWATDLIERGVTIDAARSAAIDALAARSAQTPTDPRIDVTREHDSHEERVERMAGAIAARYSPRVQMEDAYREFAGVSLVRMAGACLEARGYRRFLKRSPDEIIRAALTSSDFPYLLADSGRKMLLPEYEAAPQSYRLIAARKRFKDFKAHSFLRAGDFPALLEVGENGEIQYGAMSEKREQITLGTWGRIVPLSRQALINDDLQAFADLMMKAGRRIADFENATVWALLALNAGGGPMMSDGNHLFSSAHGNLASVPAAIDVTSIGAGRAAMQKQTGLDGVKLNLMPRYLVTSPDKATIAEQFCAQNVVPSQPGNVNPYAGKLTPVSDANLTGNGWRLFADPASAEVLVYGYLDGAEGPRVETRNGFEVEGAEFKVAIDFACGATDWRGAYYNAGA